MATGVSGSNGTFHAVSSSSSASFASTQSGQAKNRSETNAKTADVASNAMMTGSSTGMPVSSFYSGLSSIVHNDEEERMKYLAMTSSSQSSFTHLKSDELLKVFCRASRVPAFSFRREEDILRAATTGSAVSSSSIQTGQARTAFARQMDEESFEKMFFQGSSDKNDSQSAKIATSAMMASSNSSNTHQTATSRNFRSLLPMISSYDSLVMFGAYNDTERSDAEITEVELRRMILADNDYDLDIDKVNAEAKEAMAQGFFGLSDEEKRVTLEKVFLEKRSWKEAITQAKRGEKLDEAVVVMKIAELGSAKRNEKENILRHDFERQAEENARIKAEQAREERRKEMRMKKEAEIAAKTEKAKRMGLKLEEFEVYNCMIGKGAKEKEAITLAKEAVTRGLGSFDSYVFDFVIKNGMSWEDAIIANGKRMRRIAQEYDASIKIIKEKKKALAEARKAVNEASLSLRVDMNGTREHLREAKRALLERWNPFSSLDNVVQAGFCSLMGKISEWRYNRAVKNEKEAHSELCEVDPFTEWKSIFERRRFS